MSSLHDPTTDELRSVLDDLVGRPHPAPDLAEGARRRGSALRRQRLSVVSAGVAAVAVLVVPSAIAVRHDMTNGVGSGGKLATPTVTKTVPSAKKADTGQHEGTQQQKLRSAGVSLPPPDTTSTVDAYIVDEKKSLSTKDNSRIAAAQSLLGSAFTKSDAGVAIDAGTGKVVGTSATFRTASGESVGIVWAAVDASVKGATRSSALGGSTLGASAIRNGLQIGIKAVQPASGTPVLTQDKVHHVLDGLLVAES